MKKHMEGIEKGHLGSTRAFKTEGMFSAKTEKLIEEFNKEDIDTACQELMGKRDVEGLYNLGKALEEKGRDKEAAEVYAKASKLVS